MTTLTKLHRNTKIALGVAAAVVTLIAVLILTGTNKHVCGTGPGVYGVAALTSDSDAALSHAAAPTVAKEIADAAAASCATIETGVPGPNPAANLSFQQLKLTPQRRTAPDPTPERAALGREAEAFLTTQFVKPTRATAATSGSPVFGTLAAFAKYRIAEHLASGCFALVTDGLAYERWPSGLINLSDPHPPADMRHRLDAVVPYLTGLRGYEVVLLGDGARSPFRTPLLTRADQDIAYVLDKVHARLRATRSLSLPPGCRP